MKDGCSKVNQITESPKAKAEVINAFKHGFYARSFPSSEVKDIESYTFQGLQDEIAALRLLNRRSIQRAFLHAEDDLAFQDAARVVIGLTIALNTTLRTQLELDPFPARLGRFIMASIRPGWLKTRGGPGQSPAPLLAHRRRESPPGPGRRGSRRNLLHIRCVRA